MKKAILSGIGSLLLAMMILAMPVCAQEEEVLRSQTEVSGDEESGEKEESDKKEDSGENEMTVNNPKLVLKNGKSYTYTGKKICPKVTKVIYKDKDGQTRETTAVKVEKYVNNTKIGSADIVISIEGYEGTITIKNAFKIVLGKVSSIKSTSATYNKIKLSWEKVAGAKGYVIYRSTKSKSGFKKLDTISKSSTTTYNDTSVKIGTTYYYKMRAYRLVDGKKVYSDYTKVIKEKAQIATAKISSAKRAAYNSITINWGKVAGANGYAVYRSTSKNGTYKKIAAVKDGNELTYTDKKCTCGVTYYYKVAAYRTYKKNNYYGSKSASVSTHTTPKKTAFTGRNVDGEKYVTLYWNRSLGATGYTIYRSTKKSSGYQAIKHITKPDTVTWKSTGLKADQVYYYKVRPFALRNGKKIYGSYSSVYKKELLSVKIKKILKYEGVPYRSAGTTPSGWDCSGFTRYALQYLCGIDIGRNSAAQLRSGRAVSKTDQSKWKPGDVLVYSAGGRPNHVALYIGDGKIMHALNSRYDTIIQDADYYERWDRRNNLIAVRRYF